MYSSVKQALGQRAQFIASEEEAPSLTNRYVEDEEDIMRALNRAVTNCNHVSYIPPSMVPENFKFVPAAGHGKPANQGFCQRLH